MYSILNDVKKALGIDDDYKVFDSDIIMHINAVFGTLNQLGVGPKSGFRISDENALWSDYLTYGEEIEEVKSYMYLRVRLLFDPPDRGGVLTSFQDQIHELEWRIVVKVDELKTEWEEAQNGE